MDRDPKLPNRRDAWLEPACLVNGPESDVDESEPAPLVEPQCRELVVRRGQPKPLAAEPDEGRGQGFDQRRSYSRSGAYSIERNQLDVLSKEPIGGQPFALPAGQRDRRERPPRVRQRQALRLFRRDRRREACWTDQRDPTNRRLDRWARTTRRSSGSTALSPTPLKPYAAFSTAPWRSIDI